MPDLQPPQTLEAGLPQPSAQPQQMSQPGAEMSQMGQPQVDPAMLQMLMQGQGQMPAMPGPQELTEAGVDPAMMQAMAAQGQVMPDLEEMAGVPPAAPIPGGF